MEDKKPRSTEEIAEEKKKEFKKFEEKLTEAKTVHEAWAVVSGGPESEHPGHKYYARLGFLLKSHLVPTTASNEEKVLYAGLIGRVRGELGNDIAEQVIAELKGGSL